MTPTTRLELVTPRVAEEMLAHNSCNRAVKKSVVLRYAADMRNGLWQLTHQGVAFFNDGRLADGQHRLLAIVESGVSLNMLVTRGLPTSSRFTMDDHVKRNAADSISFERGEHVSPFVVAVLRCVMTATGTGGTRQPSRSAINEAYNSLSRPIAFAMPFTNKGHRGIDAAPVWAAVVMAWCYVESLGALCDFCETLIGARLPRGEEDRAAVTLRDMLLKHGAPGGGVMRTQILQKTQRAIQAFIAGEPLARLYASGVIYPWPLVDPAR